MSKILLSHPGYGLVDHRSHATTRRAVEDGDGHTVHLLPTSSSLLAHNFNDCVAAALNNDYEYFGMLHTDIEIKEHGWLTVLVSEMNANGTDVIHAPAAIKDHRGITSTAIAYSDDDWALTRRLTTSELQQLPETFDISDIKETIDGDALWLLPNTGCLVMRADTWLKDFSGFEIKDRIRRHSEKIWISEVVPEDWNFGLWCGRNQVSVAGTRKVVTHHYGMTDHPTSFKWGPQVDEFWLAKKDNRDQIDTVAMVI